jgi:hypothetical protein
MGTVLLVAFLAALVPALLWVGTGLCVAHGAWRVARILGKAAPYLYGSTHGRALAFYAEAGGG